MGHRTDQRNQEKFLQDVFVATVDDVLDVSEVLAYTLIRKEGNPYLLVEIATVTGDQRTKEVKKMIEAFFEEFALPQGSLRYERDRTKN